MAGPPLKILHTNFHRGWGGQSNRILMECKGLAGRGHRVALAVPEGSALAQRAREAGLETHDRFRFSRGFRPWDLSRDLSRLQELFRRHHFDIIHTHGSQDSWAVTLALFGFPPRPIVLRSKHNVFPIRDHFFNRLYYGRWTDGIVCSSSAILEYCASKPYLRRENLAIIPAAVESRWFEPNNRSLREEWGVRDRWVAGIAGRLRPEKGHCHLIAALPAVIAEIPNFALVIVGSGSLEGELRRQVRELNLDPYVIFAGFRSDMPRVLAALDLFVMPSISEGLGTAALEAGAAGVPIVASNVGGIPEVVADGERGLLVEPACPEALARAILRFHADRDFAARCAAAEREFVRKNFSEESLIEMTEGIYREWIGRKTKTAGHENAGNANDCQPDADKS